MRPKYNTTFRVKVSEGIEYFFAAHGKNKCVSLLKSLIFSNRGYETVRTASEERHVSCTCEAMLFFIQGFACATKSSLIIDEVAQLVSDVQLVHTAIKNPINKDDNHMILRVPGIGIDTTVIPRSCRLIRLHLIDIGELETMLLL